MGYMFVLHCIELWLFCNQCVFKSFFIQVIGSEDQLRNGLNCVWSHHHHHHHLFYSGNMAHRKKNSTQTVTAQKHTQKIQRNSTTIANI